MNHKGKQKKILKGCGDWISKLTLACGTINVKDNPILCSECKQKAKNHKEEVLKGCGKDIYTGIPPRIYDCSRPCGSDPKQLCEDCKKIIDKYKEGGI